MRLTPRFPLAAGLCVMLAASALALDEGEKAKAKLGEKVPTFKLTDADGTERSLDSYKDKIVVLEWLNPGCPWVQRAYESKAMQETYEKVKELDTQIVWLTINTTHNTTPQQNQGWAKRYELKYPILLDTEGEVGHLYGAKTTPHMFVIDKEGVLRYEGAFSNNKFADKKGDQVENYVINAVQQIVKDETVSPDHVKPWGCSVKYRAQR